MRSQKWASCVSRHSRVCQPLHRFNTLTHLHCTAVPQFDFRNKHTYLWPMVEEGEEVELLPSSVRSAVAAAPPPAAPPRTKVCSVAVRSKEGFSWPAPAKAIHHSDPALLDDFCFQTPRCRRCAIPAFLSGLGAPLSFRNVVSSPSLNFIAVFTAVTLNQLPAGAHLPN